MNPIERNNSYFVKKKREIVLRIKYRNYEGILCRRKEKEDFFTCRMYYQGGGGYRMKDTLQNK